MAIYRFSASIVKRSAGRSVTAAAAYRAGARIEDTRTGLDHDYQRRGGVLHSEILTPEGAPAWMQDRAQLWNAVEHAEKRKDAQLAREVQLACPHELTAEQQRAMVRAFCQEQFVAQGMVADIALHAPDRAGDQRNHHAHVLLTLREIDGTAFGKKARQWNDKDRLEHWRCQWEHHVNRALERARRTERVDHRSHEQQGIDREPEPKLGPHAAEMERRGKQSERGNERRAVQARNAARDRLAAERKVIDLEIAREKQRQAETRLQDSIEREKQRFEAWANRQRAALQDKHLHALGEMGANQARARQVREAQIERQYGPDRRALKADLAANEQRQAEGGVLYRLLGQARIDRMQAPLLRAELANIAQRTEEYRAGLKARQDSARAAQQRDQQQERRRLEQRIEQARQRREDTGWRSLEAQQEVERARRREQAQRAWEDVQARREATRGQDRGRGRDFER
jgi:ATP-dependent exoDNAse (exonuclease V) alpha subunit